MICTRRFETEWQSHIQGPKCPVTSEPGRLDIRSQSPDDSAPHFRRAETSYVVVILTNTVCDKCVNVLMPTGSGYVRSIPRCSCYGVHWIWFPDDLPQEIRIQCNWLQLADCCTKCSVVYTLQWLLLSRGWRTLHWHQHYQVTVQDSLFIKTRASWTWARPSAFVSRQGKRHFFFLKISRLVLGPSQPLILRVRTVRIPGLKQPGCKADHSHSPHLVLSIKNTRGCW